MTGLASVVLMDDFVYVGMRQYVFGDEQEHLNIPVNTYGGTAHCSSPMETKKFLFRGAKKPQSATSSKTSSPSAALTMAALV